MSAVLFSLLPMATLAHVIDGPGSTAISDSHTGRASEDGSWGKESEISHNRVVGVRFEQRLRGPDHANALG